MFLQLLVSGESRKFIENDSLILLVLGVKGAAAATFGDMPRDFPVEELPLLSMSEGVNDGESTFSFLFGMPLSPTLSAILSRNAVVYVDSHLFGCACGALGLFVL